MNPLLYFHRSSNSPSNQISEDKIKNYTLTNKEEVENGYNSNVDKDSEMNNFEKVRIAAIEDWILSRETEEAIVLETNVLMGAPNN